MKNVIVIRNIKRTFALTYPHRELMVRYLRVPTDHQFLVPPDESLVGRVVAHPGNVSAEYQAPEGMLHIGVEIQPSERWTGFFFEKVN
ncbi:hypothetical protein CDAR_304651 [Caerostris darwini]|uniref:Uncharacterized protein n=1 Tax=Caerostris darwini TaxID=1538125 RepID=A0AAV4TLH1_9ARAC|nr:hypothetical protein CDAR_304651 [Caerostris darwini]